MEEVSGRNVTWKPGCIRIYLQGSMHSVWLYITQLQITRHNVTFKMPSLFIWYQDFHIWMVKSEAEHSQYCWIFLSSFQLWRLKISQKVRRWSSPDWRQSNGMWRWKLRWKKRRRKEVKAWSNSSVPTRTFSNFFATIQPSMVPSGWFVLRRIRWRLPFGQFFFSWLLASCIGSLESFIKIISAFQSTWIWTWTLIDLPFLLSHYVLSIRIGKTADLSGLRVLLSWHWYLGNCDPSGHLIYKTREAIDLSDVN